MEYRHGFCVEPGCGEKFYRTSHNQRYCFKHNSLAKNIARSGREAKCAMCEQPFSPKTSGQVYCQDQCKKAARNLRKKQARAAKKKPTKKVLLFCSCGEAFYAKVHGQKRCPDCIESRREVEKQERTWASSKDSGLPCSRCRHSKPNKDATFGIECTIGRWLICKPLNLGARPYEALDSTA